MKIVTVVGARPQFVKCGPVSLALRRAHTEVLVHTGQHYDSGMSDAFFDTLGLPNPDYHLGVGSGPHGEQTGAMLAALERVLVGECPDVVCVYGDTNSTLAGSLAAAKLSIPVAHIEAGLRSFNRAMPEEINRVVTDHVSTWLFCPSPQAVANLAAEGITRGVHLCGDVMGDALLHWVEAARSRSVVLERLGLAEQTYVVATIHRAENTDDIARLTAILTALDSSDHPVILPLHPRTRKAVAQAGYVTRQGGSLRFVDPLGYLDMLRLTASARLVVTDSGGLQKEAYWLGVPCVTVRGETEWVETVETGWNRLVKADAAAIRSALQNTVRPAERPPLYGSPGAAAFIVGCLEREYPAAATR